ncbi:putative molybdenum cofactor biosynthesis protein [Halobacteriovorax marinus SJ]|uniref:Molybdopterin molybdenumtransferase n=1 Tax=Halobacteriovorax marinus (strain ATCC BAA-682 / DSM 15412 / SJ) TaxID=862908 RepID=E1X043_HALMS|nr:molybdopterin molybdotransferase MoeA [Halobacteriovorax marinus]CBW26270.1 putative molybdenum cofactor biosynthesis protein [Halobacteriovorax marinus SJ]
MLSASEAHNEVLAADIDKEIYKVITRETTSSRGYVLAQDIVATRSHPPFNRVMMDGIAISFDGVSLREFKKQGIARAGEECKSLLSSDHCIEVMTGAPLPMGCDCVIPYEEIIENEKSFLLSESSHPKRNQFIHPLGVDYQRDDKLISKGTLINSGALSIIYSQGLSSVEVYQLESVAIISTGDELVDLGEKVLDHQIYRSNSYVIKNEIESFFTGAKVSLYHFNDDKEEILEGLASIVQKYKVIIISGGVSKGKFDFIPQCLEELGIKKAFHKVRQRPGKPLFFGKGARGQVVFGLPGNPVSSFVNTRRHIIPLLQKSFLNSEVTTVDVFSDRELELGSDFTFFIPAKISFLEGRVVASPRLGHNSGDFSKLTETDGFFEVPAPLGRIEMNKQYQFYPWGGGIGPV